jgi:hypothetical protein
MARKNRRVSAIQSVNADYVARGRRSQSNNDAANRMTEYHEMHIDNFTELCMNRFEWTGLPPEVDVRFLELTLFYYGVAVYFYDDRYDKFFAMRGTPSGLLNPIDNPTTFNVFGNGFIPRTLSTERQRMPILGENNMPSGEFEIVDPECVPIWANYLRRPEVRNVQMYARRLADIDTTLDINTLSARRTKVIAATQNTRLSVENFNRQVDEGQPVITVANSDLPQMVTALDLGIDTQSIEFLHRYRTRVLNEAMGLLGINNQNQDKVERLVAAEVDANNEQVASSKNVALNARQDAARRISERYGTEVTVDYKTDQFLSFDQNGTDTDDEEGKES